MIYAYEVHYSYLRAGVFAAKGYGVVIAPHAEAAEAAFLAAHPARPGDSYKINKVIVSSMDPLYRV